MSAVQRARAALAALDAVDRPEVWVMLRPADDVLSEAAAVDGRVGAGERLPLAGLLLAVKNNIDVAGLRTTAGCPGYGQVAARDAPAVARLRASGAVVLGATNLDQFATGLVGTRSPHGAVRDARRPDRISGGSSSGSAVAVALGLVDVALGTDTAGSGRVPAALQGVVGIKATLGLVPTDGVVPACRSWDAVTVFARDLPTAELAMGVMAAGSPSSGRPWPADAPLAAPPRPRVAVPRADDLAALSPGWRTAFERTVAALGSHVDEGADGAELVEVDLTPFLAAARLLYDGALVAERYAAVGAFLEGSGPEVAGLAADGVDPVVGAIIMGAGRHGAAAYVADEERVARLRQEWMSAWGDADVLLLPTAPEHPTLAAVAADPVGVNARMGTYTNSTNLFDLCGVAVPAGTAVDGGGQPDDTAQFGVTVLARPFADAVAADVARRVVAASPPVVPPPLAVPGAAAGAEAPSTTDAEAPSTADAAAPSTTGAAAAPPWPVVAGAGACELVVVGAHRRGQPLAHELTSRGAAWVGPVRTAPRYRLLALPTRPPKPGLVRALPGEAAAAIVGERWLLSPAALGAFLAALPTPMLLGAVELEDGTWATGFACDAAAAAAATAAGTDLTAHADWVSALAAGAVPVK